MDKPHPFAVKEAGTSGQMHFFYADVIRNTCFLKETPRREISHVLRCGRPAKIRGGFTGESQLVPRSSVMSRILIFSVKKSDTVSHTR